MKSYTENQLFINSWERMTPKALAMILRAEDVLKGRDMALQIAKLQALCLKPRLFLKLTSFQIQDLFPITRFLDRPNSKFFMKSFTVGRLSFHAPADLLANFRMIELVKADFYLNEFLRTENEDYINKLIAVLYREAWPDWEEVKHLDGYRHDIRRPFFSDLVEPNAAIISKLDKDVKYAILFTYLGCFQALVKANKSLFPQSENTTGGSSDNLNRSNMWINILFDLGETTFFAGQKAAKQAFIHEALPFLNKKAKEATR